MARSDSPEKKTRWYQNIWQAYQMTREVDRAVTWWLLGSFVVVMGVAVGVGFIVGHPVYLSILGFPFAVLATLLILVRRTEAAAYRRLEGQPGAVLAAVRMLRRGWDFEEDPVAIEPRTQDLVFRGVGRPGIVLISEGSRHRVTPMLEKERKRLARVLPRVPVHTIQCGNGEGQVPLPRLTRRLRKLRPMISKRVVAEVRRRLHSLGGSRIPLPKGIDPFRVRPDRKAVRGR